MWTPESLVVVGLIFTLAGFVKGVAGIGLPTVAIALMAASIGLKEGIVLVVVPTIATNIWQAFAGGQFTALMQRLWSLLATAAVGAWIGGGILAQADAMLLAAILGVLLCLYSAFGLTTPPLPPPGRAESWLSPVVGVTGGMIGGMTGSYGIPVALYLQAMRLPRDELVQALGMTFLVFTLGLATSLTHSGLMSSQSGVLSLAATAPSLVGMGLGQKLRHRLSEAAFRPVFFLVLLGLGAWLVLRPLVA